MTFELLHKGKSLGDVTVSMPGMHNVLNALATIAVADELSISLDSVKKSLATFGGVQRRFTIVGAAKHEAWRQWAARAKNSAQSSPADAGITLTPPCRT